MTGPSIPFPTCTVSEIGCPLHRRFFPNRWRCQAKIGLMALNFCQCFLRPAGCHVELRNIRPKHVLHRSFHLRHERPTLGHHRCQVHPVGQAREKIASRLIPIPHIFPESQAEPMGSVIDPFCPRPDRLDEGPRIGAGVPADPIQRQSAPGRLVGASFGLVTGNLPLSIRRSLRASVWPSERSASLTASHRPSEGALMLSRALSMTAP